MARLDRRHERKNQRGQNTNCRADDEHAPVNLSWKINYDSGRGRRKRKHKRIATPIGHGDSADGGNERKKQSFSEKLLDQTTASGAEGQPHRHLMPAQERAREQEIAYVRAGDEQNKKHDRHRDRERRSHVSRLIEGRSPQRRKREVVTAVRFRIIFFQPLRNGVQLSIRLLTRYARF